MNRRESWIIPCLSAGFGMVSSWILIFLKQYLNVSETFGVIEWEQQQVNMGKRLFPLWLLPIVAAVSEKPKRMRDPKKIF